MSGHHSGHKPTQTCVIHELVICTIWCTDLLTNHTETHHHHHHIFLQRQPSFIGHYIEHKNKNKNKHNNNLTCPCRGFLESISGKFCSAVSMHSGAQKYTKSLKKC
ncbi:hypothetical protein LOK49_LG05G00825 [Camellia lanceoleosa]|uniref:Uncharacterized protein n=1 Tax=Camellia lanceoleosa TaxID=1840588 RepID=A0ACC0HLT5_9ERIC|nr:hypothetical protein LOK49_LG05G00825 [Camellia lanceoleosa]